MKRSEMLGIIKSVIKHNSFDQLNMYKFDKISAGKLVEILSERILNRIIKEGMLPPKHYNVNDSEVEEPKMLGYRGLNGWEPEDGST